MARVAYGYREDIQSAIERGVIPKDTIIITEDSSSELFFYDKFGVLKPVSERDKFDSMAEAEAWVGLYDCAGRIVSVYDHDEWTPYIVQDDGSLSIVDGDSTGVVDVQIIDGGSPAGL